MGICCNFALSLLPAEDIENASNANRCSALY
jgi:hypothetical protein